MTGPAVIAASTAVAATANTTPATRTMLERIESSSVWEMPRVRVYREAGFDLHGRARPRHPRRRLRKGAGNATDDQRGALNRAPHRTGALARGLADICLTNPDRGQGAGERRRRRPRVSQNA